MNEAALGAAGLWAALNMLILIQLSNVTGSLRRKHKVLIGDGGVAHLQRVMRGHANAIENMPMFFVMLVAAALIGAPSIAIHALGLVFTIGRGMHAWHFMQEKASATLRFVGFGVAFLSHLILTLGLIGHWVWRIVA